MQIDLKKNQSATSSTFFFIGGFKNMVLHMYVAAGRWIMAHTVYGESKSMKQMSKLVFQERPQKIIEPWENLIRMIVYWKEYPKLCDSVLKSRI